MLRTKNWTPDAHPDITGDPITCPVLEGRIKRSLLPPFFNFSFTFILSLANAFSLDQSKFFVVKSRNTFGILPYYSCKLRMS